MEKFSYPKMKRPGKIPDPPTLALHGPSTSDMIGLDIIYHNVNHLVNTSLSDVKI